LLAFSSLRAESEAIKKKTEEIHTYRKK